MTLLRKTRQEVIRDIVQALQNADVVTNLNAGGVARTLVEVVGLQIADLYDVIDLNMAMRFPSTSAGVYLDLLGESFGLTRNDATSSVVTRDDKVIRFSVATGRLIDVLPAGNIPAGTQITNASGSIVYQVTEAAVFNTVDTETFVAVESLGTGRSQNVGVGVLSTHDLAAAVQVTNLQALNGALDLEADDSFRFRITNASFALQQANRNAIHVAALRVSDVSDVVINEYAQGVGTVEVLVVPTSNTVSSRSLEQARLFLNEARGAGTKVTVRQPEFIPVSISIQLTYTRDTTDVEQSGIISNVQEAFAGYVDDIRMGGSLIINEIRQRVMQVSERLLDMRITCLNVGGRPQLLVNQTLAEDELFFLDFEEEDPIAIT